MSEKEQNEILGKTVRDYKVASESLGALRRKVAIHARAFRSVADALDSAGSGQQDRTDATLAIEALPIEEVLRLLADLDETAASRNQLRSSLKEMGHEPKD